MGGDFTPGPKQTICCESICILPLGHFVMHYCKEHTHALAGFTLHPYHAATYVLVGLYHVGRRLDDNDNNIKLSREMPC